MSKREDELEARLQGLRKKVGSPEQHDALIVLVKEFMKEPGARYCLNSVHKNDRDDVAQKFFLRVAKGSRAVTGAKGKLVPYLLRCLRNATRDSRKAFQRARARQNHEIDPDTLPSRGSMFDSSVIEHALSLLGDVKGPCLCAIRLRFCEGLTYNEIAEKVGYNSAATVRVCIFRALEKLRERMP